MLDVEKLENRIGALDLRIKQKKNLISKIQIEIDVLENEKKYHKEIIERSGNKCRN